MDIKEIVKDYEELVHIDEEMEKLKLRNSELIDKYYPDLPAIWLVDLKLSLMIAIQLYEKMKPESPVDAIQSALKNNHPLRRSIKEN